MEINILFFSDCRETKDSRSSAVPSKLRINVVIVGKDSRTSSLLLQEPSGSSQGSVCTWEPRFSSINGSLASQEKCSQFA